MTNDPTGTQPLWSGGTVRRLPWLLRRTNQRYRAAIRDNLAERGFAELPQLGYWALTMLSGGASDAGVLIHELGVSKQAVSKLVNLLVTGGFVERAPNDADRRRTSLLLTTRGREAADVIADAAGDTEEEFMKELGSHQFAELLAMLERLARVTPAMPPPPASRR